MTLKSEPRETAAGCSSPSARTMRSADGLGGMRALSAEVVNSESSSFNV